MKTAKYNKYSQNYDLYKKYKLHTGFENVKYQIVEICGWQLGKIIKKKLHWIWERAHIWKINDAVQGIPILLLVECSYCYKIIKKRNI